MDNNLCSKISVVHGSKCGVLGGWGSSLHIMEFPCPEHMDQARLIFKKTSEKVKKY